MDLALEQRILARRSGSRSEREAAMGELFEALRRPVFGACLHIIGDQAEAQDAVQDTFVAVYRQLSRFRGEARLSTWVFQIAIRVALRRKLRPRHAPMTDGVVPDAEGASPEEATADRQKMAKLQDAIAQLSAEHRTVLSLFAVDGLSHRQIAEILDIPEGTVWSRLHKARKRLREIMAMP